MSRYYKVPAVVVGAGINGLGVIRSLGAAGVPVVVLGIDKWEPGMRCRYGRKIGYRGSVIDALVRLGQHQSIMKVRPVLFLTQERIVSEVSEHREELMPFFRISLPSAPILNQLLRKDAFYRMAKSIGAAVPKTLHLTEYSSLDRLHELTPPLVVKPSLRDESYDRAFRKAYKVGSVDEAKALVQRISIVLPDVVVQEWIDGDDSDIYFCFQFIERIGEPTASFVGRKLWSWPPYVGGTASCTQAPEMAQLIEPTTLFFRHVGVIGLAGMEYKLDRRTGRFLMIEPTVGRTDYQEEVATLNGTNIPLAGYCSQLGLPIQHSGYARRARIWRDRASQTRSISEVGSKLDINLPPFSVVDALWRIADPMPAVTLKFRQTCNGIKRRLAR